MSVHCVPLLSLFFYTVLLFFFGPLGICLFAEFSVTPLDLPGVLLLTGFLRAPGAPWGRLGVMDLFGVRPWGF